MVFDQDYVLNGDIADVIVAVDGGRITRLANPIVEAVETLDPTRRLAHVTPTVTQVIGADPGLLTPRRSCWPSSRSARASHCLELTVDYASNASSTAVLIGKLPGHSSIEWPICTCWSNPRGLLWATPSPTPPSVPATLARLAASEAFCTVAGEAIQCCDRDHLGRLRI